jgi:hypothetical protein
LAGRARVQGKSDPRKLGPPQQHTVMAPKKKGKPELAKATETPPGRHAPNWPEFAPLMPESDLAMQELLGGQIVTIPNLWTTTLCKSYVSFLSTLPLTTTPGQPKKGHAVRVNDRYQIDDPVFAERLWSGTALKNLVTGAAQDGGLDLTQDQRRQLWGGEVVGLNPNIRIYRYTKGQFFDQHCECGPSLELTMQIEPARGRRSVVLQGCR